VKIGLFAINYATCAEPELAIRVARHAEAAGFESVWTGEHVVLPDPAPPGFTLPPTLPFLDTVVALTLLAVHTRDIRVASGIIVLPLRNPVILAKELASVDVVSQGRLIAGFAAGYIPEEFAAAGVSMAGRGQLMDDYIRALQTLWSTERPDYQGNVVSFRGIDAHPRPVQHPGPPIVVGGEGPAALRRAVTMANGWYGFGMNLPAAPATSRRCSDWVANTNGPLTWAGWNSPSPRSGRWTRLPSTNTRSSAWTVSCCCPSPTSTARGGTPRFPSTASCVYIDAVAEQIITS
jgi:probable F420-dependent oxidoreductase